MVQVRADSKKENFMLLAEKLKLTVEDYLKGELLAKQKHEFVDGEAYAMAGASERHNLISLNFASELKYQLKGKQCLTFIADMKVNVEGCFFYPDLMVVCQRHDDDSEYVKNNPQLIVEVLSKSTRFYDHSIKQDKYLSIESLEYYVLIEQEYCEVCVLSRDAGFVPKYYTQGDTIPFPKIDVIVTVDDQVVY